MLSRQFLAWAERASAGERADAARDLARAFLYADIDPVEHGEMERVLTCLTDDPSPVVRRALAEALAAASDAPHHVISALASDQPDIAALVLARSPILADAELIDAAALREAAAQCGIASRPGLSAAVAGALAEVGRCEAVLVLCRNQGATLADVSVRRILERFGDDGDIRSALGARHDLDVALRQDLVAATADALRRFATDCGWVSPERARRVAIEATERATLVLATEAGDREGDLGRLRLVAHLRRTGQLTPALVLRALMSGQRRLFEAALAELSGQSMPRVAGLVRHCDGLAFAALVRASGLPEGLLSVIRAALQDSDRLEADAAPILRRQVVARALARCAAEVATPIAGLTALLRRFEAEAAREESRAGPGPTAPRAPAMPRQQDLAPARSAPTPSRGTPKLAARIEPRFDAPLDLAVAA